jgi:tRNA G18 (ribose-2'-O)-methylase SpoU
MYREDKHDSEQKDWDNFDPGFTSWAFNVIPALKDKTKEEIIKHCQDNSLPFAVMMANLRGDFNFASVIRSANAFGAQEVFYFGRKKYDKRGTTGVHHYTKVTFISEQEVHSLKDKFSFVCLENNRPNVQSIHKFDWKTPKMPLIILGEEGCGIVDWLLDIADFNIEIPQRGSVPSVNAAVAASIAMNDFAFKHLG